MPKKEPRQPDPQPVVADWEIRDYSGEVYRVDGAWLTTAGDEYKFMDHTGVVFVAQKQTVVHIRRLAVRSDSGPLEVGR